MLFNLNSRPIHIRALMNHIIVNTNKCAGIKNILSRKNRQDSEMFRYSANHPQGVLHQTSIY
jgi:hypothetical protein